MKAIYSLLISFLTITIFSCATGFGATTNITQVPTNTAVTLFGKAADNTIVQTDGITMDGSGNITTSGTGTFTNGLSVGTNAGFTVDDSGNVKAARVDVMSGGTTNIMLDGATGDVTANSFTGDGSGLTDIPASNPFDQSLNTTDSERIEIGRAHV